jgi:nicotinamidase-related amidase
MPTRAEPSHVYHPSATALLLVDLLQAFPGADGGRVLAALEARLPALVALRRGARAAGAAIIYVNDEPGPWRSSREALIARAVRGRGREVARRLRPGPRDYLVFKPSRSGFHQSPLQSLLEALGARRVVIAGVATDVCVLATAGDAVVHKLAVSVPRDASCAVTPEQHDDALALMRRTMGIDTRPAARLFARRTR